jgi:hypothetical protein
MQRMRSNSQSSQLRKKAIGAKEMGWLFQLSVPTAGLSRRSGSSRPSYHCAQGRGKQGVVLIVMLAGFSPADLISIRMVPGSRVD